MMLKNSWRGCCGLFLLLLCQGFTITSGQKITDLLPLPAQRNTWEITDSAKVYAGDNLFMLIDGGADLYLEYGFVQVVSCRYENQNHATLQVEIYQMSSDSAAYGIYTSVQSVSGKKVLYGNDARMFDYYMVFWKGNYFITITGSNQESATKQGMEIIAAAVDNAIHQEGSVPAWIKLLPADNLKDLKYFRGNIGLSNIYSFGSGNIFNLRQGVYGNYGDLKLFLIPYGSVAEAKTRFMAAGAILRTNHLFKNFKTSESGISCFDNYNHHVVFDVQGKYIRIVVFTDTTLYQKFLHNQ